MNLKILNKLVDKSKKLIDQISHNGNRHFSFILDGKHIVSYGMNDITKTHPMAINHCYPYLHSEVSAILNFKLPVKELCKYIFVNIRIGKDGRIRLSKPCSGCQTILTNFGVDKIFFTNDFGNFELL